MFECNNSRLFRPCQFPAPGRWSDTAGYIFVAIQLAILAVGLTFLRKAVSKNRRRQKIDAM